ncbi:MAG: FixH family protein [Gammaproteobacteria bacterium]
MLQSLFVLPLGVVLVTLVFLLIFILFGLQGKQAAAVTALLALTGLMIISLLDWPGADVFAMYVAVLSVTVYLLGVIATARESRKADGQSDAHWFHWGPALIIGFFLVLFAADSVFVMLSTEGLSGKLAGYLLPERSDDAKISSNFPGVVASNYQKKESQYNAFKARMDEQTKRGWQVKKGWLGEAVARQSSRFQVAVNDRDDQPVEGAVIKGLFQRPSDVRLDQEFTMLEVAPGVYQSELSLPKAGVWKLVLGIRKDAATHELFAVTTLTEPQ